MPRIKKRGLDYFPIDIDFIHNRIVRRLMKREGDSALAVLIEAFSYIYAGEGYYVRTGELFYEDLSANMYEKSSNDVKRIISLAVEYGLFDATLFSEHNVLTSAEIQRQYLFSTRRRAISTIEPAYNLIPSTETVTSEPENATNTPENVTSGTHSIAQNSIAEHSTEYPPQDSPSGGPGGEAEKEEIFLEKEEAPCPQTACNQPPKAGRTDRTTQRKEWTNAEIERLQPPADGLQRNLEGLIYNLRSYHVPLPEQYAIICKSNFGIIGHPMWKGFGEIRESHGKIRQPGRYLLSLCNK